MGKRDSQASEADELRELIRQAHEAMKDIRQALRDWRHEADKLAANNLREVGDIMTGATEAIAARVKEFSEHLAGKTPVMVLCGGCGELSYALADPEKKMRCGGCGASFLLRATLREQVKQGLREGDGDRDG